MIPLFAGIALLLSSAAFADAEKDATYIKKMAGCYQVQFQFEETFPIKKNYQKIKGHRSNAHEWIEVVKDEKDHISLQHFLIVGKYLVKHWRQDWLYEATNHYQYSPRLKWNNQELSRSQVQGQWTQKVYQVDDSPRYECSAPWIHWGNEHYWECRVHAPLPRRESKRTDYNVLNRVNRHQVLADGWNHQIGAVKTLLKGKEKTEIVHEVGLNIYKKVEDSKCVIAQNYHKKYRTYWSDVRSVWNQYYSTKMPIHLKETVKGFRLYEKIFGLGDEAVKAAKYPKTKVIRSLHEIIRSFLIRKDENIL